MTYTGEQIRDARKLVGITKGQLAQKLGISVGRMNLIEKGQADMTEEELFKYTKAMRRLSTEKIESSNLD